MAVKWAIGKTLYYMTIARFFLSHEQNHRYNMTNFNMEWSISKKLYFKQHVFVLCGMMSSYIPLAW